MMRWLRIWAVASKEFLQLRRDRLTFAMIVMVPLIELLLFGYAINTDVRHIPAAIVDQSQTTFSRQLAEDLEASQVVSFTHHYTTPRQAQQALIDGTVRAALVLPVDLEARVEQKRSAGQWLVDGSDTMISSALLKLEQMPLKLNGRTQLEPVNPSFQVALFFNPERRSAINIVPGLVGVILTMTMIMFTSAAIVRERERGNLELLITTPIHAMELMLGKIIPYIFVGLIQVSIILGLGHIIFGVPINGSPWHAFLATLLFICASLTLGLLISTVTTTQLQAMQMTVFILLPSILLSGFMFPYEGMPIPAQWIAEVLPATHFIRLIRGIILRGATLPDLGYDAIWLICFTTMGMVAASLRFKKRLD